MPVLRVGEGHLAQRESRRVDVLAVRGMRRDVERRPAPDVESLSIARARKGTLVTAVWIILGVGIAGALVALMTSWPRRDQRADLGAVSHQWIAEHRSGQGQDPRR